MEEVSVESFDCFVRAGGSSGPTISRAALKLHTYSILVSIEIGQAGLITDEYLDAITVETNISALELTLAGLWTRIDGGYRVDDDETLRVAREVQRHLIALDQMRAEG